MRIITTAIAFVCLSFTVASGSLAEMQAAEFLALIKRADSEINSWQIDKASITAKAAVSAAANDDEKRIAAFTEAKVQFYKGNYEDSFKLVKELLDSGAKSKAIDEFYEFVSQVNVTASKFNEVQSGNFRIRYVNPKDQILIDYALDTLEKSYRAIGKELRYYPSQPALVEIYPTLRSFSIASTLPEADIKRTGVVGVCKFNKVMILSPRLLPKGYGWLDTLSHEYVHYVVFKSSENKMSVWLHEGIAKSLEARWNSEENTKLDAIRESLLAKALKNNSLITLDRMHPSFGMLKSADEAQLAFAQVSAMVEFLYKQWGDSVIADLIVAVREYDNVEDALKSVTALEFDQFYRDWESDLRRRDLREIIPNARAADLDIATDDEERKTSHNDIADVNNENARDHTIIGDLLKARGRMTAAEYEYEKALKYGNLSPIVANRLASTRNELGDYRGAVKALLPIVEYFPGFVDSHRNLGKSYYELGRLQPARNAYETAISINPFDPQPHVSLYTIYNKLGLRELEKRELEILEILSK